LVVPILVLGVRAWVMSVDRLLGFAQARVSGLLRPAMLDITRAVTFCNGEFCIVLEPCYIVIDNKRLNRSDLG
jgi:hypothetical protein